jgi:hypothetical protein
MSSIKPPEAASVWRQASPVDSFLFATLEAGPGLMQFSVLSGLARIDVDPWREATLLAEMPAEAAVERLTDLLARLPTMDAGSPGWRADVPRLIGLLHPTSPRRSVFGRVAPETSAPTDTLTLLYVVVALILSAQVAIVTSLHPKPVSSSTPDLQSSSALAAPDKSQRRAEP